MGELEEFFRNKDILVTGGCGSIGSKLVEQLLRYDIKRVKVLDHNESGLFHLQERLKEHEKTRTLIGDIRDEERLKWAMQDVDIVFHAAALKHVPLCEYNPFEAVSTNVSGTQNLINVARAENVDKFIAISTDKAVNPINTMGATKLLSEKLVLNAPLGDVKTVFSCVRFGNVLNTDGSVIPIFEKQIKTGEPVTVTSKEMIRFFMSIKAAVDLILKAAQKASGREIFILKMDAMRIVDLAEVMIEEFAPKYGNDDVEIEIIGIRPGEKIYELLMSEEEAQYAEDWGDMFVLKPGRFTPHYVSKEVTSQPIPVEEYNSRNAKLLTKKEIKVIITGLKSE
ncbi:NDP-sugar epimerase [Candidatus Methanophagaceae archaeon]|nr:NDP-sugar epimerase [Methanophagales archaeon]